MIRNFNKSTIPLPRVNLPPLISKPLDIEIGSGVGKYAIEYCLENKKRSLIAIDKSRVRHQKMMNQMAKVGKMSNLIPIRENAVWFVAHEITANTVENYFFLYPNPYPKKKQANKRWYRMPFMEHVLWTLKKKGRIHFATNMKFYADEAEKFLQDVWNLKKIEKSEYKSKPRTHFEKKYLERGETCWNLIFQKTE